MALYKGNIPHDERWTVDPVQLPDPPVKVGDKMEMGPDDHYIVEKVIGPSQIVILDRRYQHRLSGTYGVVNDREKKVRSRTGWLFVSWRA